MGSLQVGLRDSQGNSAAIFVGYAVKKPVLPPAVEFGISTHTNFRKSIYGDDARTLDVTVAAGPTYLRDLLASFSGRDALWRRYKAAGVKGFHVTVGQYGEPEASKPKLVAELVRSADLIHEVTGWNEPDDSGNGGSIDVWLEPVVAWQKWLWETVKGNPRLAHIKVGLGAIRGANKNGKAEMARLMAAAAGYFEFVDLHIYPGPKADADIKRVIDEHLAWAGGNPAVVSEYGGTTANMTDEQQARVIATGLKYLASKGVTGYVYELWDDVDPTGKDIQSHFGIYNPDGTPKPAVAALRALNAR